MSDNNYYLYSRYDNEFMAKNPIQHSIRLITHL